MQDTTPQPAAHPAPQPAAPVAQPVVNGSVMDIQPPRTVVAAPQQQSVPAPPAMAAEQTSSIPSSQARPVLHEWKVAEPADSAVMPAAMAAETPAIPAPAEAPVVSPQPAPAPTPAAPAEPSAQPVQPPSEGGVVPAPPEERPSGSAPAEADKSADNKGKSPMAIPSVPMKPHKRIPLGAFMAVLVGSLLIGLAVFVYTKQNKSTTANNKSSTQSQSSAATEPITAADVSDTMIKIDKSVTDLNDTSDFAAADLSDATLDLQ